MHEQEIERTQVLPAAKPNKAQVRREPRGSGTSLQRVTDALGVAKLPGQAQPTVEFVRKIRPKTLFPARPVTLTSLVIRSLKESTYRTKQGQVRVGL